jgi:hypothetical protein
MNDDTQDLSEMGTKPIKEHEWLQNLVGQWRIESEMIIEPNGPKQKSEGTADVKNLGGLWAFAQREETMPGGATMTSYFTLGYDVTFKEYRGCLFSSASSHLWKYEGKLSEDGKTMTLNCEGPNMVGEGTALYRDVIELIDKDHQVLTSSSQDETGQWQTYMESHYYRV